MDIPTYPARPFTFKENKMGEIADMMIDGDLCEGCGVWIGEGQGYSRTCHACQSEGVTVNKKKVTCKICNKKVKKKGLRDHNRVVHGL